MHTKINKILTNWVVVIGADKVKQHDYFPNHVNCKQWNILIKINAYYNTCYILLYHICVNNKSEPTRRRFDE